MGDRRFERRVAKHEDVEVRSKDAAGTDVKLMARLEDLSPSGACLKLEGPLRVLSVVAFSCGERVFTASVRYCKREADGFIVGLEFQ